MDYVVGLPWSEGYNAVLVIVCRLTKMRHLIPCRDTCTAEELADLYLKNIARQHGLPKTIISDRNTIRRKILENNLRILGSNTQTLYSLPPGD